MRRTFHLQGLGRTTDRGNGPKTLGFLVAAGVAIVGCGGDDPGESVAHYDFVTEIAIPLEPSSPPEHGAANPSIARSDSSTVVVYTRLERTGYGEVRSTGAALLDPEGDLRIQLDDLALGTDPQVATDGDEFLAVAPCRPEGPEGDLCGLRISDDGDVLGSVFVIADSADGPNVGVASAVVFDGTAYRVQLLRTDRTLSEIRVGVDGSVGPAVLLAEIGAALPLSTRIGLEAVRGSTGRLIAWNAIDEVTDESMLLAVRVDASQTVLDDPPLVLARSTDALPEPALAFDGTRYHVAFRTGASGEIRATTVDTDGTVGDAPLHVGAGASGPPALAFDGDHLLATWTEVAAEGVGAIRGARFTSDEVVDSPPVLIQPDQENPANPALVFDGTRFLAIWANASSYDSDLAATRIGSDGRPLDDEEFVPNAVSAPDVNDYAAAANEDGFLIVWSAARGTSHDVFAARIDAAGALRDPTPIQVTSGAFDQRDVSVASVGDRFLVSWREVDGPGFAGIHLNVPPRTRRIGAAFVDAEGIVETLPPLSVEASPAAPGSGPVLAGDEDGALVTWLAPTDGGTIESAYVDAEGDVSFLNVSTGTSAPEVAFTGSEFVVAVTSTRFVRIAGGTPSVLGDFEVPVLAGSSFRALTGTGSGLAIVDTTTPGIATLSLFDASGASLAQPATFSGTSKSIRTPTATFDGHQIVAAWLATGELNDDVIAGASSVPGLAPTETASVSLAPNTDTAPPVLAAHRCAGAVIVSFQRTLPDEDRRFVVRRAAPSGRCPSR